MEILAKPEDLYMQLESVIVDEDLTHARTPKEIVS